MLGLRAEQEAAQAAVNGVATFPGLSIDAIGNGYTVAASSAGLTGATSAAFDVGAGAPATLAFVAQPATVQAGATLPSITVEIRDVNPKAEDAVREAFSGLSSEVKLIMVASSGCPGCTVQWQLLQERLPLLQR